MCDPGVIVVAEEKKELFWENARKLGKVRDLGKPIGPNNWEIQLPSGELT